MNQPKVVCLAAVAAVGSVIAFPFIGIPLLSAFGFTSAGIAAGSIAAWVQSVFYGGATTGVFSVLQSIGAQAAFPLVYNFVAGVFGAGVFLVGVIATACCRPRR
ncbi:hypothetical protein D9756_008835 [Leucocoprinus leucothites]|uniref:Uncharacterized protein n=1 Tax=Leucocoprinus leucothites TaxID=201217 RepID=A0A8H5CXD5_9AGAR|nr:hypothetical protein D9756_008835 [Leucoagaricus leucothites]